MSQSDSFIEEVTDEVRRDRLFAMMRRYGWIAILAVVLIVGGAAWNEYRKAQDRAAAEAAGDAILSALEQAEPAERLAALDAIVADNPAQGAVVAYLAAASATEAEDTAGAADRLGAIGRDADLPQVYRDLAAFKALTIQGRETSAEDRRAGFTELARPGSGLRLLAEEQIALTLIEDGDTTAAIDALRAILQDAEVTSGLRQRVSQLMVALGENPVEAEAAAAGNE